MRRGFLMFLPVIVFSSLATCFGVEARKLEVLRRIEWAPLHRLSGLNVFEDAEQLRKCWIEDGGNEAEVPKVDFEKEIVIALFDGVRERVGFKKKIESLVLTAGPQLKVLFREHKPEAGKEVVFKRHYPSDVVVVERTNLRAALIYPPIDMDLNKEAVKEVEGELSNSGKRN